MLAFLYTQNRVGGKIPSTLKIIEPIKYRNRELDNTEIEKLTNILLNNKDNDEICFGASVLLKSKPQADLFWTKLDKETQERYQVYPIYNLYKVL